AAVATGRTAASCVVQGATFWPTPISPGVIATLFGSHLGPPQGVSFALGADGKVPQVLAGMQVTVAGLPAPLLYVQDNQINFIVPQALPAGTPAQICVNGPAGQSCLLTPVLGADPGIFKIAPAGYAILNQDGSVNDAANPAVAGSIVSLYGTGFSTLDLNIP